MQNTHKAKAVVPIEQKAALTKYEAAEYSNIGINKIEAMLREPPAYLFSMWGRTRNLSNAGSLRSLFEQVL